ncbi:RTA1 like protein-domain-containing protein [Powellomyces hirtus]|nr:RTA1 like protein-domain-containing protein [Powellomyces hirtus]
MDEAKPKYDFYKYDPIKALAVVGGAAFAILLVAHVVQASRYRTWYMLALAGACALEIVGFGARFYTIDHRTEILPGTISEVGLVLPPIFNCAALYVLFGRLIAYVGNEYSFLRGTLVGTIFIVSDVITFLVQIGGSGLLVNGGSPDRVNLGKNILLGGLGLQLLSFGLFTLAVIHFDLQTRRSALAVSSRKTWSALLLALHVNSVCILGRSVYRILEFGDVIEVLKTKELYFYVFDTVLMLIATAILVPKHPGKYIGKSTPRALPMESGEMHRVK